MLFPKPCVVLAIRQRFDGQTKEGGICLGFVPFGLTVLGSVTPRPGVTCRCQFPRLAPDIAPMYALWTPRMTKMSCNRLSRFSGLNG